MNKATLQMRQSERGLQRRKEGVDYQLRVVPGSGGRLELVERPPQKLRMLEWMNMALTNGF